MVWSGHLHGFEPWAGSGAEYGRESLRRPGVSGGDHQTQMFLASKMPPVRTGHWLLKRKQLVATWTDAAPAVAWLRQRYEERPPMVREDGRRAYLDPDVKAEYALDALGRGIDVTWAYWTQDRALTSFSVVACVNRFLPEIPCPEAPGVQEPRELVEAGMWVG